MRRGGGRRSDAGPLHLRPICLRKLQWNRGFDVRERDRELLAFHRERGLTDEATWVASRLRAIGPAPRGAPETRER